MRAFIIRPFGTKNGIDFDRVEASLIGPALARLNMAGRTTLEIVRAGNIRTDMFQRLLTADLVVADISIHNASVFYELGVRHALRKGRTFLVRSDGSQSPFELETDRYFAYNHADPAADLDRLVEALRDTLNSDGADSPVFKLLPNLPAQNRVSFLAVPLDFREEVDAAAAENEIGHLDLLADELAGFEWESEGLRVVGRALFRRRAYKSAIAVWEKVRRQDPLDLEGNQLLATSYQRTDDLARADQAINRVLTQPDSLPYQRAELYSLLARNAKARWRGEWEGASDDRRSARALSSAFLYDAAEAFERGFTEDLNHFYSGLSALALLRVIEELASASPDVWEARFETDSQSRYELEKVHASVARLSAGVSLCLQAQNDRLGIGEQKDVWVKISEADLTLLTSKRAARVATAYHEALDDAPPFAIDSVRSQLLLYKELGVMLENVQSVLSVLGESPFRETDVATIAQPKGGVLLFGGHLIDAPDRRIPRFPPDKERAARQAIKDAVEREMIVSGRLAYGIAGGASGGDILFHEVCAELGLPTRLFLALPKEDHVQQLVQPAGRQWVERFEAIYESHLHRVLKQTDARLRYLPQWLAERADYDIWQRNALWMIHSGLTAAETGPTLVALWDGKSVHEPGGTADLVQGAMARGVKTVILDIGVASAGAINVEAVAGHAPDDPEERAAVNVIVPQAPPDAEDVFDVFISYNRADQPDVEKIAKELKKLGIRPWFDEWQLRPGLPWQDELEKQIEQIKAAAVFVGKQGIGPWQDIEQDAFLREFRNRRCPVIPVILPNGGDAPKLPIFLGGMTWVDFRKSDPRPMERLIWGITGKRIPTKDEEE